MPSLSSIMVDLPQSARSGPDAGLCATCVHQQLVHTTGLDVLAVPRSREDPAYPRYPRLPVLACRGYEPAKRVIVGSLS